MRVIHIVEVDDLECHRRFQVGGASLSTEGDVPRSHDRNPMTALVTATAIASILDPTIMAHIAVGEAGGWGIWGSEERAWEIQEMVIWVAKNQSVCAWAPEDYDPRLQFYAWEEDITDADVERARQVLEAEQDVTNGMLHVISEQDRIKLGFPRGDIVECGVAPFCVHWFREWPNRQSNQSPNPVE